MKIIIIGPVASGKTTLLHKIIRMNENNYFSFILDGVEQLGVAGGVQLPNLDNMIITAQNIENIPAYVRNGSLILNVQEIRR